MEGGNKKVLCVGKTCLDIVMFCESYPVEDSDQRCMDSKWRRGGNASNSATVFAEFNIPCELLATVSCDIGGEFMKQDFEKHNISTENCHFYKEYESPIAVVWINSQNGSRTIVASNKSMPEVSFDDFKQLNLNNYRWIHFECRQQFHEIRRMIHHVREWNNDNEGNQITVSIEIEKPKKEFIELVALGDYVFTSKDFARVYGHTNMLAAVQSLCHNLSPGGIIICPWSDKGASAKSSNGPVYVSEAFVPKKMISTLGAGDTFIAATIIALLKGIDIGKSIEIGCKVAGEKCGMYDTQGLSRVFPNLL